MKQYCVYILSNKINGVLYIGRTENLRHRIEQHKSKTVSGFSKKYNLTKLVYLETYNNSNDAALREKRLKKWKRDWKIALIESQNPKWEDLSAQLNN